MRASTYCSNGVPELKISAALLYVFALLFCG